MPNIKKRPYYDSINRITSTMDLALERSNLLGAANTFDKFILCHSLSTRSDQTPIDTIVFVAMITSVSLLIDDRRCPC